MKFQAVSHHAQPRARATAGLSSHARAAASKRRHWRHFRGTSLPSPRAHFEGSDEILVSDSGKEPYTKSYFDIKSQPEGLISLKRSLELDGVGLAIVNFAPGQGYTFTHSHESQEELYICVQGRGMMQLDNKVFNMEAGDIVRVSPETRRSVYANPCSKIGYSLNSNPENFVLYVVSAIPPKSVLAGMAGSHLIDDGVPHFGDVPTWFRDNPEIVERNLVLKERFDRINSYNGSAAAQQKPGQQNVISDLYGTKFLGNLSEAGGGESSKPSTVGHPALVVCSILIDNTKKRMLVSRQSEEHVWDMPGGRVKETESPEEGLSRQLKVLGVEAHPESFKSFFFGTSKQNDENLLLLVYTCEDWCGDPKGMGGGHEAAWLSWSQLKNESVSTILSQTMPKLKPLMRPRAKSTKEM